MLLRGRGVLTYIIPYAFTNQNYAELSRRNILDSYGLDEIVDTSEYLVFDNAMVKNIILRVKNEAVTETAIKHASNSAAFSNNDFCSRYIDPQKFRQLRKCRFETKDFEPLLDLKSRIESISFPLRKICFIGYGVRVNSKYDKQKPKAYYVSPIKQAGYKPFVEGKDIERYAHTNSGWLNYQPSEHYNPMFPELFENEKIMFINVVSGKLRFAYDADHYYNSHTVVNCVRIDKIVSASHISAKRAVVSGDIKVALKYPTKFILGVLNSSIIYWYFSNFLSEGLHIFPEDASVLPIPHCSQEIIETVVTCVEDILMKKSINADSDTSTEERRINELLCDAYRLTSEDKELFLNYE